MALAAIPLFLFLSTFPALATALPDDRYANISAGQRSLQPTNTTTASWRSPSGLFFFGFYKEGAGFRVGIWLETGSRRTIVWTANRDDPPVSSDTSLALTWDGLLLQSAVANDKLISEQITPGSCSYASILDSGNLVLYNFANQSIWESFDSPTDTILGGQKLASGKQLFASASDVDHTTGRFRLAMQTDGNLVLYPANTTDTHVDAYWNALTDRTSVSDLRLYESGAIYLINHTGGNMTLVGQPHATEGKFIHRATLDSDGIFRLYSHSPNGSVMNSVDVSSLEGKCEAKGFCGLNSYCELVNEKPNCSCPPGYDDIDHHRWFVGCQRNSSTQGCLDSQVMNTTYRMMRLFSAIGFTTAS